jgi:ABC-type antimicrobial peptide transport system permease subunit
MALGARRDTVLQMIVSQGMKLTAIGTAAGLGGAFALTSYLRGMLFGLTPLDPFTFMLTTIVLLLTALLACYLPARRVLSIDPTTSLRQE